MKFSPKFLVYVTACCILLPAGCSKEYSAEYEILHLENILWATNVSTSYILFGVACEDEDRPEVFLPASEGDLLYLMNDDDVMLYYRYNAGDSTHLVIKKDSLKPGLVFVNGTLQQIEISRETSFADLETELTETNASEGLTLIFSDTLTGKMVQGVKELPLKLQGCGIFMDGDLSSATLEELLVFCKPAWLAMEAPPEEWSEETGDLASLNLLWISGYSGMASLIESSGRNLETLLITGWDPGAGDRLDLSGLKKLHTLIMEECNMTDLSAIELPGNLQRLHILACDTLSDISRVAEIPKLKSLGLAGVHDSLSLEPVMTLSHLERISLPARITQEELSSIVRNNSSLKYVEFAMDNEISDLSPLTDLEQLKILYFQADTILPAQIGSLDQLELLIIGEPFFSDAPEKISQLHAELPDTRIVPGSGLCMGSGWLLLFIPLVIAFRFFFKKR